MTTLQSAPEAAPPPPAPRRSNVRRTVRRLWGSLTSMRTALVLLFLLALAAIPGSVFPQRGINPITVDIYLEEHPSLGPVLDRLGMFDVYASPWFAAIYLLLVVSLVGCLVPRVSHHVAEIRRPPPRTPARLDRLPAAARLSSDLPPEQAVARARSALTGWRTTVRAESDGRWSLGAERGYLRETGNLVFHIAILVLLAGLAWGSLGGWRATVLVQEGETACTTVSQFDAFTAGAMVTTADLPELCLTVDEFTAEYLPDGQPADFVAQVSYGPPGAMDDQTMLRVNSPLRLDGTRTYLLNHGYSPVLTVTDPDGNVFREIRAPFLPQDAWFTSEGVFKLPDAQPQQYGFEGFFLPTRPAAGPPIVSVSPIPARPAVTLLAYSGDLGLDGGRPQSVYALDPLAVESGALERLDTATLEVGDTWVLPDGGTVRFEGYDEWATLQVARDPGQFLVLAAAVAAIMGLVASLTVRRRRLWVRATPGSDATAIEVGGLARTNQERFASEFESVVGRMADKCGGTRE